MKILILSSLAQDTGSYIRAYNVVKALKAAGIKTKFIKPPRKSLPYKLDMLLTLPGYIFQALIYPCDKVFCVKSYPNVMLPAILKKINGAQVIVDTDDLSFAYTSGLWSNISRFIQEVPLRFADLHTYHNPKIFDYLSRDIHISKAKTYQLLQGVSDKFINHQSIVKNKNKLIGRLNVGDNKLLIYTGHFDVACDLDIILKSLPKVVRNYPKIRLLLLGDGGKKKYFQNLTEKLNISKYVIWMGLVEPKKVIDYIDIADIALIYYRNQKANFYRSSLKLREYLVLGKRTIANSVGELADFKKYTYQSNDSTIAYASKIIELLNGYDDQRQIRGREFIKKYYSWNKIIREFINRLEQLN